jgi:ABC-type amino acid transport substrate-binding protein
MKRILVLVLVILLALSAAASAQTLRVGMECDYAPFNWTQAEPSDTAVPIASGGFADGYDVRIAKRSPKALAWNWKWSRPPGMGCRWP